MKTVSTLCATSTVGIAACGYALGRPCEPQVPQQNLVVNSSSPPSLLSSPSSNSRNTASPALSTEPPSTTGSKKAWYRRFSASLLSVANSSHSASPTNTSSICSRIRNLTVETPTTPPPARNKLVKRRDSRSASANSTSAPSTSSLFKRPSTALPGRASVLLSVRPSPRPATSLPGTHHHPRHLKFRPYDPKAVSSWRKFFAAKRHNSKKDSIKRVYPNCNKQPTLVLGPSVSHGLSDADSICSAQSIYYDTRQSTPMDPLPCSENNPPASPLTPDTAHRPFSLSTFFSSSAPQSPSRNEGRHSSTPAPLSPSYMYDEPLSTPSLNEVQVNSDEIQRLPSRQSLSSLHIGTLSDHDAASIDNEVAVLGLSLQTADTNSEVEEEFSPNNPLSILMGGGSERASTLIGSEVDDQELVLREPSDTVYFDSVRTRVNEGVTPVRVESLFDYNSSPPTSPLVTKQPNSMPYSAEIDIGISPTRSEFGGLTPPPARLDGWVAADRDSNRTSWGSDWDSPEALKGGEISSFKDTSMLRSKSSQPSHLSVVSPRESGSRSSFEDWNEAIGLDENTSTNSPSSPANTRQLPASWRPKTAYPKVTVGLSAPLGNFTGSAPLHSRSQSLPSRTNASKTAASENWDDDFADDGFNELGGGMIVPKAIQEHQKKVLRHLDSVKEFATLVEELKRLREIAVSSGIRTGASRWMWDEADSVIALASTGTMDDDISVKRHGGGPRHRLSKISSFTDEFSEEEGGIASKEKVPRRASVLAPDDDIFGGLSVESAETPLKPLSLNKTVSTQSSPSCSRRTSFNDRCDPIALARSMMEKVQRDGLSLSTSPTSIKSKEGNVHFDTRMLSPLLDKVRGLLVNLRASLQEAGNEFGAGPYPRISVDRILQVRDSFELGIDCRAAEVGVI